MESRTETITNESTTLEISTITHEGHNFTAQGAYITRDLVYAYATPHPNDPMRGKITTWDGALLGYYHVTSRWHRYGTARGRYTMDAITATLTHEHAKGTYHGRYGSDWGQLVTLRPSKYVA